MPDGSTDWGMEIRRLRQAKFIKQSALADVLSVDQGTISRWERNISIPDLDMQRRLRALLVRPIADDYLLKHTVLVSLGQIVISNADRIMQAVSRGYGLAHGFPQQAMIGKCTRSMYTEEGEKIWQESYSRGFYRGDVASVSVVCRANSLSGHRQNMPTRVVWAPIRLSSGETLLRGERVDIAEGDYAATLASNGGSICIVMTDDLVQQSAFGRS